MSFFMRLKIKIRSVDETKVEVLMIKSFGSILNTWLRVFPLF